MKFVPTCKLCSHPKRDEIHAAYYEQQQSMRAIAIKFFPEYIDPNHRFGVKPVIINKISKHLKWHYNIHQSAAIIANTMATSATVPLVHSEERVFAAALKQRVEAATAMENMIRVLMERANVIQDYWDKLINQAKQERCPTCNRGGETDEDIIQQGTANLMSLLGIFKEMREQLRQWTDIRSPATIIQKIAEKVFVAFAREATDVYLTVFKEAVDRASSCVQQHIDGDLDVGELRSAIMRLDNGVERIAFELEQRYNKVMEAMAKEFK